MPKWGSVDTRQLKRFRDSLEKLEKFEFNKFSEDAVRVLAERLWHKVVKRTPVGRAPVFRNKQGAKIKKTITVTGASGKKRTFLSREGVILARYWSGYTGGRLRNEWTIGRVKKRGSTYKIEVYNPVEYASYVEYGHIQTPGRYVPAIGKRLVSGWAHGKFMLTISEKELQRDASGIIEKKLNKALKEAFGDK